MRIAICDDDERELHRLSELVAQYQASRGKGMDCRMYGSSTDFVCEMKGGEYDLVLLDVLMPGISGIQAARELRELDKNVKIIFLSNAPEFAVESYSVEAYHYLLKPVDTELLFDLLDKIAGELTVQDGHGFLVKNREGVVRIAYAKLAYVEVINKTIICHMSDGSVCEQNGALTEFEENFRGRKDFIKTHRSYLVNLGCVQALEAQYALMGNGNRVPISRLRHRYVQDAYIHFMDQGGLADSASDVEKDSEQSAGKQDRPWRILLVDDDPGECSFWAGILRNYGCIAETVQNGKEALQRMAEESYECVLLDVMIPDEDGFSVCEKIRKLTDVPIIFLSCLTEADRQVEGFAAGGADYITKDTPAALFWAKVETRIRLTGAERTQLCYGPLLLDLTGRRVLMNGEELALTPVEFDLLWRLSENVGHVHTPEELFEMLWGGQPWDGGQTVQTHMSRLRRKLEEACAGQLVIEPVWGQGYRFVLMNS